MKIESLFWGGNFNQWKTKSDLIRIISKEYRIEQESEKSFRANPVGYKEVNLFVDINIIDERNTEFSFTVRSPELTIDKPQRGKIIITNPENAPKVEYGGGWIGVVVRAIAELAALLQGDNCIDKAIRGCGEGNVNTYDEGGWFSGCSFSCK